MIVLACALCGEPNDDMHPMVARHDRQAAVCVPCVLVAAGALEARGYDTSLESQRAAFQAAVTASTVAP